MVAIANEYKNEWAVKNRTSHMWQISIRVRWWVCVYSFSELVPLSWMYMHVDVVSAVHACQFLYENDTIMKWKLALSTTAVFFLKGSTTVAVCTCLCLVVALIYGEIKAWFFLYCGFFICLARLVCYFITLLIISCLLIFIPPHIIISGSHLYMR